MKVGLISDTHGPLRPEAPRGLEASDHIIHAVVAGHWHRPAAFVKDAVLFVNPGSAGPRRFSLPVSLGHLLISGERIEACLTTLEVPR